MLAAPQALTTRPSQLERLHAIVHGAVQGVGFRPYVYNLARSMDLFGWVVNTPGGVVIEVEGASLELQSFIVRLESQKPLAAYIQSLEVTVLDPAGYSDFKILESDTSGASTAVIMADLATCPQCLKEMSDPADRRYRYPFINCTHCGPRYSIVLDLPYDRPNTTMRGFVMCPECREEYDNPDDRRFHAQPIACPQCGPQAALWDKFGTVLSSGDSTLCQAAEAVKAGQIVAVKGIGGFQVFADARSEDALQKLRLRKQREEKPFAVMYPSIEQASQDCWITDLERRLLLSPQSPIVLTAAKPNRSLAHAVAPGNPDLGIMLPYSPLHHLLMDAIGGPVVATSGNLSDEPICIDEREALSTLSGIADVFLVHNRPIARHVDDSVVRIVEGRELIMRRARGYAPLPLPFNSGGRALLAVGAHQKSTVALSVDSMAVTSQHIGDLDTLATWKVFKRVIEDLSRMYNHLPVAVACDLHPDYRSTNFAAKTGHRVIPVQHHYAHVLSCMEDNQLSGKVLGIAWDGTGYGTDGTIWGGEFLTTTGTGFDRFASLLPFCLPGGETAVHEPRRTAAALLIAALGEDAFNRTDLVPIATFSKHEQKNLATMVRRGVNAPVTTSMGRLFDGIAAIIGLRQLVRFEGQAAMELEFHARGSSDRSSYSMPLLEHDNRYVLDWRPTVLELIADRKRGCPVEDMARRFHNTLAQAAVLVARKADIERVVLSGGCFQNRLLTEGTILALRNGGFTPYWHQRMPPNDAGIAVGQLSAAVRFLSTESTK